MLTPARILGMVMAATLLSGCGLRAVWSDVPPPPPVITPAPNTPEPDERTLHPYTGALSDNTACVTATSSLLHELELVDGVGGAVQYVQGVGVRSNAKWWTVVVRTAVDPHGSIAASTVPDQITFATNVPSSKPDDWEVQNFTWKVGEDSASAEKAAACLTKLPLAKTPFPKPKGPADTYNGKPARAAACHKVSDALLGYLEQVGQVGGAITYPRGQMVRANRKWSTVAVAVQVNPNSQGFTKDNVPAVEYFVTNAPALGTKASAVFSFPIKGTDKASAKAGACLK
jgi:hypothetical protein